jgi:tripartite-type tricarboxylate transporter receptor subunit TctC
MRPDTRIGKHLFTAMLFIAASTGLATPGARAEATAWPDKPLRMIVPFPPGGGADTVARLLSKSIGDRIGKPVIVENKPGATGTMGVAYGLLAPADGYTMIWCTPAAQYLAPASVRYNPVKDLAPVSLTASATYILLVNPALPIRSVSDLTAAAKAHPGGMNYATAGIGGQGHLMGAYFNLSAGTDLTHVPYTGEAPALMGIMTGEVQAGFISSTVALPLVKAGKVRALGTSSARRLPGIPEEIPPIAATLPGFDVTAINYIAMRAGTPRPIIDSLSHTINEVLASPPIREQIAAVGVVPAGSTPEELGQRIAQERAKWSEVLSRSKIVLE